MTVPFLPKNSDFEADVRSSFARQAMMDTIGAGIDFVGPGEVHIVMKQSRALTQQNGFVHAGAITSIADSACGYAAFSLVPPDADVLTVEFKINLLSPARAHSYIAKGRVLRPGRTISTCMAEVYGSAGETEQLVAVMLATIAIRRKTF